MPTRLHKHWRQLKTLILLRPMPHTVMSWRFLLPNQTAAIRLHRKVFLNAWPTLPRWGWALIALYSSITWLFFFSWLLIIRSLRKNSGKLKEKFNIPRSRQIMDLLTLAFVHAIPAQYYYQYNLFRQPHNKWLDYIYTFQLAQWHRVVSGNTSTESQGLMSHKHEFEVKMAEYNLPTITATAFLAKGSTINQEMLFAKQSLFLKPDIGNRKIGCYELRYQQDNDAYKLVTPDIIQDKTAILDFLKKNISEQDYLIQPLLENHASITSLCNTQDLVTIRLVTGLEHQQPVVIYATLEIPVTENKEYIWPVPLDPRTGIVKNDPQDLFQQTAERDNIVMRLSGQQVPDWEQLKNTCLDAHSHFPDILTIGWDMAITNNGIKLLEGNTGWGIAAHQIFTSEPALNGLLSRIYITN